MSQSWDAWEKVVINTDVEALIERLLSYAQNNEMIDQSFTESGHAMNEAAALLRSQADALNACRAERTTDAAEIDKWIAVANKHLLERNEARSALASSQAECQEQARLNGMGSERELKLMAQLVSSQAEVGRLLNQVSGLVTAWESMPVPKRYTYMEVEKWLIEVMAPSFDKARAALKGPV